MTRDEEIERLLDGIKPTLEAMSRGIVLSERKLRAFGASERLIAKLHTQYGISA
jgi:hypothetical protein